MGGAAFTGYTVTASPGGATGTGASSPITVTGLTNGVAYTFTVTATNAASLTGAPSAASNSVTPKGSQTITFVNPGTQNFGTSPNLSVLNGGASSTSGLTVAFTSSTTSVCTVTSGGILTFISAGTCTISADQAGDSSFLPATQVSRSFTVSAVVPGAPTIGTATAGDTQVSVAFSAPVSNGGSNITGYTVTVSPAHVAPVNGASSPIVVTGLTNGQAYTFTVTADNAAGTGPASASSNTVTPKTTQTITFNNPGAKNFGTTPTLSATSDSSLTPSFTSSTTGVCTITSGGTLTFISVGTCTINADQAGNATYLPATQVTRSFAVNAIVPSAPVMLGATAGDASASISFSAPSSSGGSAITSYTVTASPGGATQTATSSPITITGLTNGTSYSFTVKATNSAGSGSDSAVSNVVVPKGNQTITFDNLGEQVVGAITTVNASASSGLSLTIISNTPSVCTFAANKVTAVATGSCSLTASQPGNNQWLEAVPVSRSFTVKPAPNKVPVITQGAAVAVTMSEDGVPTAFSLSLSATDGNNDPLTWSIKTPPQHGSANVGITGGTGYVPEANYHGEDTFVVEVSDGKDTASTTVSVTITSINDDPVLQGAPATQVDQDAAYQFVPSATDLDDDKLTFSISNQPAWASFNTQTGALSGTPDKTHVGVTKNIVISVSDGTKSVSLPAFDLKVIAVIDPALPVVTAPPTLTLNAVGLFTPVSLAQLVGLSPTASDADIEQAIKNLAKDSQGNPCCTVTPSGDLKDKRYNLQPGRHTIVWTAKNAAGLTATATQLVDINPMVSLSKSQVALRGSLVNFRVILNGPAPQLPLTIPLVIDPSSSANESDYSLATDQVTFTQEGQSAIAVPVTIKQKDTATDSRLVIALGAAAHHGANSTHTITMQQGNLPPQVSLTIKQSGLETSLVTPSDGPVTVTALVVDPNSGDTHSFDWSATSGLPDTDGNPIDAVRSIDPKGLAGSHAVSVTVTDSGGTAVKSTAYFRVIPQLPSLAVDADTDNDGLSDQLEGTGDGDDNGIPEYQDNMPSTNIIPQQLNTTAAYLVECDPGVRCGLGLFARSGTSGGVQILDKEVSTLDQLSVDPAFEPVGGVFDFAIRDLPTPGQSVRVVIPQRTAIPANAVYRKYQRGKWVNFVTNTNNAIHSALGAPGYCPPPGSNEWVAGLTAGHNCVQLTIEDGGPNDDDGLVNSAVVDPGAVSVKNQVVDPVTPTTPTTPKKKKGGFIDIWGFLILAGLVVWRRRI